MRIEIEIPKDFEGDYDKDKFADFFNRVLTDIIFFDGFCCDYERETAEMFRNAFKKSKVAFDVEAVVAELEKLLGDTNFEKSTQEVNESFYEGLAYAYGMAISIVRGKE